MPIVVLALWFAAASLGAAADQPAASEREKDTTAIEAGKARQAEFAAALLAETNRVRRENGVKPLRPRAELSAAADDQAAFMALTFSARHTSPIRGQETPADRVRRRGLDVALVLENVASMPAGDGDEPMPVQEIAATLVRLWFESPGHRANLLRAEATHFGGSVRLACQRAAWCAFGVQVFSSTPLRGSRGEVPP